MPGKENVAAGAGESGLIQGLAQLREIKASIDGEGIRIAAIGSPIGKSTIDKPASYELDRVKKAWSPMYW